MGENPRRNTPAVVWLNALDDNHSNEHTNKWNILKSLTKFNAFLIRKNQYLTVPPNEVNLRTLLWTNHGSDTKKLVQP